MGPGVHSLPLKFNFAEPGFGAKFHKSYISWEVFRKSVISLEIVVLRTQCRRKVEIICVDFTSRNLGHVRSKVAGTTHHDGMMMLLMMIMIFMMMPMMTMLMTVIMI